MKKILVLTILFIGISLCHLEDWKIVQQNDEIWQYEFSTNTWALIPKIVKPNDEIWQYEFSTNTWVLLPKIVTPNDEIWQYEFSTNTWVPANDKSKISMSLLFD
ncbi:Hypothetical protein KVN_LOCUS122 [uncultured virus]|nr:Hypothetical protein KVN_LOCUS122 [uncultured virus]